MEGENLTEKYLKMRRDAIASGRLANNRAAIQAETDSDIQVLTKKLQRPNANTEIIEESIDAAMTAEHELLKKDQPTKR